MPRHYHGRARTRPTSSVPWEKNVISELISSASPDTAAAIPAWLDITAVVVGAISGILVARERRLDLIGYTTQAAFLLNLGLTDLLAAQGEPESQAYIRAATACQTLLSPQEMGELFKVIAFGRNIDPDWPGFALGDLCHKL